MEGGAGEEGCSDQGLKEHKFTEMQGSEEERGGRQELGGSRGQERRWKEGKSESDEKMFVRGVGQDLVCSGTFLATAQCVQIGR